MAADHAHDHDAHGEEYVTGSMPMEEQTSTYAAFNGFVKWGCLAIAVAMVFLIGVTSTGMGFIGAAAAAFVLLVLGVVLLRSKPASDAH